MSRYISASVFKDNWTLVVKKGDRTRMKILLQGIANHNYKLIKDNNIQPRNTWKWTKSYIEDDTFVPGFSLKDNHIIFEDLTTDAAIVKYTQMGKKTIALNFANSETPGGGYLRGAIDTQEEELCRQYPRLFTSLDNVKNDIYPFPLESVLITRDIERMRESRDNGYELINNPITSCGIISAAAPDMRKAKNIQFHIKLAWQN